jgi:hypothetical protein
MTTCKLLLRGAEGPKLAKLQSSAPKSLLNEVCVLRFGVYEIELTRTPLVAEERAEAEAEEAMRNDQPETGGLELDDTSEFVRSVTFDPVAAVEPKKLALQLPAPAPVQQDVQEIDGMEVDEKEDGEAEEEDEEAMLMAIEGMITAAAGGLVETESSSASIAPIDEDLEVSGIFCIPGTGPQFWFPVGYSRRGLESRCWNGLDAQDPTTTGDHSRTHCGGARPRALAETKRHLARVPSPSPRRTRTIAFAFAQHIQRPNRPRV